MKKIIFLITVLLLVAAGASAQDQPPVSAGDYRLVSPFEADLALGYRWIMQDGNPLAGEYVWLHSGAAGQAIMEYDPLPHRFLLETFVESGKEWFGDMDYAYKDVVMLTLTSRSLYKNYNHVSLGIDNPATPSPSNIDFNPGAVYGLQDMMNRAQVRFKTPDFPFHIYFEARDQEKKGTIQQIFLRSFSGGDNRASQSRDIDYVTTEAKATVNSHLGPVELEYSHAEKRFKDTTEQVMLDTTAVTYAHNLVPRLESSDNTIKLHTNYTGRIAAAFTYSSGDKENKDSGTNANYTNAAADLTWIPHRDVTISARYRHYEIDENNAAFTTTTVLSGGIPVSSTFAVRDAISTTRDMVSAFVRYRMTQNLTLRVEYQFDSLSRDFVPGTWQLDPDVKKNTVRVGATYRFTSRLMARADYSHMSADVPANSVDTTYPSSADALRGLLTWSPTTWFNTMLSAGTVHEERSPMPLPFTGDRKTDRNRAMGTMTFLLGKRMSLTPGYAFYQNTSTGPIAYTSPSFAISSEDGVPYFDTAQVASLALGYAISDLMTLTADVSQIHARGSWQNSGVVPGSNGIPLFSNMKEIDNEAGAGLAIRYTKNLGTDFRYSYRKIDNQIDNTLDGTNQIMLATVTYKW